MHSLNKTHTKLTIIAILFFILSQWHSIYFRQYNRPCPLGLGDSDFYIARINYFKTYTPFSFPKVYIKAKDNVLSGNDHIRYLLMNYSVPCFYIFAQMSNLLNLSAESIFHYQFYFGIILAAVALFLILKHQGKYPYNVIIGFLVLAFYTGRGSYHGFYWVTPSFYCLIFWLLLYWSSFYSKSWKLYSPFFLFLMLFSHPMGSFAYLSILSSLSFYGFLNKSIEDEIKKILYLFIIAAFLFSVYKILTHCDVIMPILAENSGMDKKWSFDFQGFVLLLKNTPFSLYFLGIFLPLTINGIYFCFRNREYKAISLFISAFLGTTLLSALHLRGERTFLFLEISVLLIIIYGLQETLNIVRKKNSQPIEIKYKLYMIYNAGIIILTMSLCLFFIKNRISIDFVHKCQNSRIWKSEQMKNDINKNYSNYPILFIGSDYSVSSILSFDGWWDKLIVFPDEITNKDTIKLPDQCIAIGTNYKYYNSVRSGIAVYFPENSEIILKTGALNPGQYILSFKDTKIHPDIQILSSNGQVVSDHFKTRQYQVVRNIENRFPSFLFWYKWFSKLKVFNEKFNISVVRTSNEILFYLSIHQKTSNLIIKNNSEAIYLMGNISLTANGSNQIVFQVDLDNSPDEVIAHKTTLNYNNHSFPLLWQDPNYYIIDKNGNKLLFVLKKNYFDIKLFTPLILEKMDKKL